MRNRKDVTLCCNVAASGAHCDAESRKGFLIHKQDVIRNWAFREKQHLSEKQRNLTAIPVVEKKLLLNFYELVSDVLNVKINSAPTFFLLSFEK